MLIYNITFNVETQIESEWLEWMKKVCIVEILKTKYFNEHRIFRLINEHPDTSGTTYAVQFTAMNITDVQKYLTNQGAVLQNKLIAKFGQKVLLFMTLLEEV
tara:strand:- start:962 stop:1267 length:306 start_codon:yes stop_codon:yes gene_type:complete